MLLRIFIEPQQGATYDDQLAAARATEELGFDAFFRSDHYMAFSGDGLPGPTDVTGLWSADGPFSYSGSVYSIADSPALPKPAQRPRPPIILGGAGAKRTPALAARFADEFNVPFHPLPDTAAQFQRVRAACEAIGRDPATMVLSAAVTVRCAEGEVALARRAAAIGRSIEHVRQWDAGGFPQEVVERLHQYRDAGAQRVYLQTLDLRDLDHLALLATEVMPHV